MSLDGGLGDVTDKNVSLLSSGSEKITGVRSANGEFFWVITHFENRFYAYRITAAGLNTTPVVSTVGPNINDVNNIRGALKASPRGDKLAIAHAIWEPNWGGQLILHDFDNATGVVSNSLLIADDRVYYGVEFSSNSSKLFASGKVIDHINQETTDIEVLQFDLEVPDISASRYSLAVIENSFLGDLAGALQIAINGKIYYTQPSFTLSVINTPNAYGLDADFRLFDIPLGGKRAQFGLPPFLQSFFESIVTIENFCFGDATQFTTDSPDPITAIQWNFGDPASGANNTSTALNPTHVFTSPGLFTVTIDVEFSNRAPQTFIEFVEISEFPAANQNVELVQCDVDGVDDGISRFNLRESLPLLLPSSMGFTANFFETLTDAQNNENEIDPIGYTNQFNGQTIYVRLFQVSLCFEIAPLVLRVEPLSDAGTTTLSVCNISPNPPEIEVELADLEALLLETYPSTNITFYDTEEDALLELNQLLNVFDPGPSGVPELYFRAEINEACATIGHIIIDARVSPNVDEDQDIFICPDEDEIVLEAGTGFVSYEWLTGETTDSIIVNSPGIYTVTVFNGADCDATITFNVVYIMAPPFVDVVVTDFSDNNTISIMVDNPIGCLFSIDNGFTLQESSVFTGLSIGAYTVQIWKDGCLVYEQNVLVGGPPRFFTPNQDGFHDTWHMVRKEEFAAARVYIFDRFGKLLKQLSALGDGWDGTYNGNPLPSNDYWYRIELGDGRMVSGNFTLKR